MVWYVLLLCCALYPLNQQRTLMTRKLPRPGNPLPKECICGKLFTMEQPVYCYDCLCFTHTVYWLRRDEYTADGLTTENYNTAERDKYTCICRNNTCSCVKGEQL